MRRNHRRKDWALFSLVLVVWFFLSGADPGAAPRVSALNEGQAAAVDAGAAHPTVALFDPDLEINHTIRRLLERKHRDPAEFFAHWSDNIFHSVFADFDNDGRLDAAFSGRLSDHHHKIEIWRGNGVSWDDP